MPFLVSTSATVPVSLTGFLHNLGRCGLISLSSGSTVAKRFHSELLVVSAHMEGCCYVDLFSKRKHWRGHKTQEVNGTYQAQNVSGTRPTQGYDCQAEESLRSVELGAGNSRGTVFTSEVASPLLHAEWTLESLKLL